MTRISINFPRIFLTLENIEHFFNPLYTKKSLEGMLRIAPFDIASFLFHREKPTSRMRRENKIFFRSSFQWKRLRIMVNQYVLKLDWGIIKNILEIFPRVGGKF